MLETLDRWITDRGWVGSDPYEALNATRLVTPLVSRPLGRRVVTQLVKRAPLDVRPLLGIRPQPNAAALANVVSAYARGGFLADTEARRKLGITLDLLEHQRSPGWDEPCWGYPFDVQTRVFFYPRGSPNSIATSFAGQALLDAYDRTRDDALLTAATQVGEFFLAHVPQTEDPPGAFFGYLPADRTPIHNANMLVCALLARLAAATGREDFHAAADRGVLYTVERQRPNGSWPYGELPHLGWVDGHHTGYVLQALMLSERLSLPAARPEALLAGMRQYRRDLFLEDGTPKFTTASVFPTDIECAAQGIQTFALAATLDRKHLEFARAVFDLACARLRRADGAFIFQRGRFWANHIAHLRWGAASMLAAVTHLLHAETSAA